MFSVFQKDWEEPPRQKTEPNSQIGPGFVVPPIFWTAVLNLSLSNSAIPNSSHIIHGSSSSPVGTRSVGVSTHWVDVIYLVLFFIKEH